MCVSYFHISITICKELKIDKLFSKDLAKKKNSHNDDWSKI